jgi:invasion protein IalB
MLGDTWAPGDTWAQGWALLWAACKSSAVLAVCALIAVSSGVSAQTNPAGSPSGQPQSHLPQLLFSPWVKLCNKDADPRAKRLCLTFSDGRLGNGQLLVNIALAEVDGEQRKLLRLSMPHGVALQHGTRLIVDQMQPATAPFVTCLPPGLPPGGCISDYEATADLIGRMKSGQILTVQAIHMSGQAFSWQLGLKDFAKAYDSPPTDPAVFAQQQKKQQDELRTRGQDGAPQSQQRPKN